MSKNNHYPFEKFPHITLTFSVPRKQLLSSILDEMLVSRKRGAGEEAHKLSQLGKWSDEQLAPVVPLVVSGANIKIKESFVTGTSPGKEERIQLFPLDSPALLAFNMFNGYHSLSETASALVEQLNWDSPQSFAYVRGVFLAMVMIGICQPKYAIHEQY